MPPEPPPPKQPSRRKPVHRVLVTGDHPTIVFITVCTKDRMPWLASEEVHGLLVETWSEADEWRVGRYVVMPDHVHLFVGYAGSNVPLENWVRFWKSSFSKRHGNLDHRRQSGFWDRALRRSESYEQKWEYVRQNPFRHKLVEKDEHWPYQGEINVLSW